MLGLQGDPPNHPGALGHHRASRASQLEAELAQLQGDPPDLTATAEHTSVPFHLGPGGQGRLELTGNHLQEGVEVAGVGLQRGRKLIEVGSGSLKRDQFVHDLEANIAGGRPARPLPMRAPTRLSDLRRRPALWQHGPVIAPRPTLTPERRGSWITAMVALVLLAALLAVRPELISLTPKHYRTEVQLGVLLLAVVFGGVAIRSFVSRIFFRLRDTGLSGWRPAVTWCFYVVLGLGVLSALNINLNGLLAAGAVIGVVVGVAAQTSLSSVFAGIVLLMARPFTVGSWVLFRSSLFGAYDFSGVVIQIGVVYTTMDVGGRLVRIPNSAALASALTVSRVPIQLDMELLLPPQIQLVRLHRELTQALQLGPGENVTLRPVRLTTEGPGLLTCQLQIRAHRVLDLGAVNRAIVASSEASERIEPEPPPAGKRETSGKKA